MDERCKYYEECLQNEIIEAFARIGGRSQNMVRDCSICNRHIVEGNEVKEAIEILQGMALNQFYGTREHNAFRLAIKALGGTPVEHEWWNRAEE